MPQFELTRPQEDAAEKMAEQYGSCRVEAIPPVTDGTCDALLVGLTGGVEMEFKRVRPDGTEVAAEHMRPGVRPTVVYARPRGYALIVNDRTTTAAIPMPELARALAKALARGDGQVRAEARLRGSKVRPLTGEEQAELLRLTTEIIRGREPACR